MLPSASGVAAAVAFADAAADFLGGMFGISCVVVAVVLGWDAC